MYNENDRVNFLLQGLLYNDRHKHYYCCCCEKYTSRIKEHIKTDKHKQYYNFYFKK